ncbi:MAG TPA: DUF4112 domain-containing protein [Verrucomicrobiae bacterium]
MKHNQNPKPHPEEPPIYEVESSSSERAERITLPVSKRLERMRGLSRLLDTAFQLPGGFRIGIDPIIGLIPGIGDFISSSLSVWLLYDAARLGIPKRILAFMIFNVMMEAAVGAIPILGNLVDAVWKANARNMRLVERYYQPSMRERSFLKLAAFLVSTLILVYGSIAFALYLLIAWLVATFGPIFRI